MMRADPEARRGDHCAAELTLMLAGKREMSCFFVPLAQIRRQGKNALDGKGKTLGLLWNTALFLVVASKFGQHSLRADFANPWP